MGKIYFGDGAHGTPLHGGYGKCFTAFLLATPRLWADAGTPAGPTDRLL